MEFIIKEYGGIIILLICFSIAIGFISAFLTKCESINDLVINSTISVANCQTFLKESTIFLI